MAWFSPEIKIDLDPEVWEGVNCQDGVWTFISHLDERSRKESEMANRCKPDPIHRNETVQIEHESLDVATIAYQDAFLDAKYNYIRQAERKQATARDLRRLAGLEDARAADIYAQINAGFPVADDGPAQRA